MKQRFWTGFAVAVAIIVMVGVAVQPAAAGDTSAGKVVYDKQCAKCHGDDGAGKTKIGEKMSLKDLGAAEVQAISNDDLAKITADGRGKMPGYDKKLSKDEINAVIEYIRTFKN